MTLDLVPIARHQARAFITEHHRHHGMPQGYKFAIGLVDGDQLVGVAVAGRPVARNLDDGRTIEVTRLCTDGTPNACSMLYGACWRAAREMGYRRAVTYTQGNEDGASLKASGWTLDAALAEHAGWDRPSRGRRTEPGVARKRWIKAVAA